MSSIREVILCAGALAIGCTSAAPAREPVAPALAKRALQAASRGARAPYPSAHPDPLYALPEVMDRPESWRRGVALGLFASTPVRAEQQRIYGLLLDEIVALGATDVSLVVRWSIDHVRAHRIAPEAGVAVDDAILSWVIEAAHTRGLRTLLLPILYLDERAPGVWRGTLAPHDLDAWWTHYDAFILHYAEFAARHDVSLYSVGSELLSMETQDERWRALIARVRARFSGELTYSSNWDHFEVPSFWDALDVVGMTAYQELSHRDDPSTHELVRGWSPFHARLKNWAREHQKRFIFTEIGYPNHRDAAARPWDYTARRAPSPVLQARCYRAMIETWHDDPRLDGLYVWNWFGRDDDTDRGYSPRGKPAAALLAHWYRTSSNRHTLPNRSTPSNSGVD